MRKNSLSVVLICLAASLSGCDSDSGSDSDTPILPAGPLETLFPSPHYEGLPSGTSVPRIDNAVVADMNNDGRTDVVTLHNVGVSVLLSRGDGTLADQILREFPVNLSDLAVADFNGDDYIDVATVALGGTISSGTDILLCLGNGDGTLREPEHVVTMTYGVGARLVAADMDDDGFQDLIYKSNTVFPTLIRGHGDGSFTVTSTVYMQEKPLGLATAEFNGDDKIDLVASLGSNLPAPNVVALINDGSGGVAADLRYPLVSSATTAGDINGDGLDDLVAHSRNEILIQLSLGDLGFDTPISVPVGVDEYPVSIAVAFWNDDPYGDLLTCSEDLGMNLYLGNGNGTFQARRRLATSGDNWKLFVELVNDDPYPDIISQSDGGISIHLGKENGAIEGALSYPFGDEAGRYVALADMNDDDVLDAVVSHTGGLTVFHGDPGWIFAVKTEVPGANVGMFTIADLDGDGDLDVASVANERAVTLILGDGEGNFEQIEDLVATDPKNVIASGDFNADNIVDLATSHGGWGDFSIYMGAGDGEFEPEHEYETTSGHYSLAVGRFNADEIDDLATANLLQGTVSIYFGNAITGLTPGPTFPLASLQRGDLVDGPKELICADVNADGLADLVAEVYMAFQGIPVVGRIAILLGDGTGNFSESASISTNVGLGIAVDDVTGDGILDLLSRTQDGGLDTNNVAIHAGVGDGTFNDPVRFTLAGIGASMATGDLNDDGVKDICGVGSRLEVLLSQSN